MMIARPIRAAVVLLAVATALGVFALATQTPTARRTVGRHVPAVKAVKVPVAVHYGLWGNLFPVPTIDIRVGNGPKVPVILDTGSNGLHIFSQGVRGGVARTGHPDRIEYVDGSIQSGVLARARVTIGSLRTTRPITSG